VVAVIVASPTAGSSRIGLTTPDEVDSKVLSWLQLAYDENR